MAACMDGPHGWLALIANGRWHPSVGDPTAIGWLTVFGYALGAVLCGLVAIKHRVHNPRETSLALLWFGLASILLLLGANKQLDLQSWLTQVGRGWAKSGGWYRQRRTFQATFIVLLALGGLGVLFALGRVLRHRWHEHRSILLGITLLGLFILVRAASFHHMDQWLRVRSLGLRFHSLLEMAGLIWIVAGAWHHWRRPPE
jgi:hypothetical protein